MPPSTLLSSSPRKVYSVHPVAVVVAATAVAGAVVVVVTEDNTLVLHPSTKAVDIVVFASAKNMSAPHVSESIVVTH